MNFDYRVFRVFGGIKCFGDIFSKELFRLDFFFSIVGVGFLSVRLVLFWGL